MRNLRLWTQAAHVGVARHQPQCLLLAIAANQNGWMRRGKTLWLIPWMFQVVMLAGERALVAMLAAPHAQANLQRLLQHLVAFRLRGIRNAQPVRLLGEIADADAETGATTRENIERRHDLGEQTWMAIGHSGYLGEQPGAPGMRRQIAQRGIRLEHIAI